MQECRKTSLSVNDDHAGRRLDQFLVSQLPDISRARIQELIEQNKILVNGGAAKPSLRLRGGEQIEVLGEASRPPLRANPQDIPLDIVYEDADIAVVDKPAGMMVHTGAGSTDNERNRGTLVNALLFHFKTLSRVGGDLRPGIVHRLDKETSGLMVVAKNDIAHRKLAAQFSSRRVKKTYVALVHRWVENDRGTISSAISRDLVRRTRMTTRRSGGRDAITHYEVQRRISSPYGKFTLLRLHIETGRTHQIRVHMASLGHPVVGDTAYGAPAQIPRGAQSSLSVPALSLPRNFLHAAELQFHHPRTGEPLVFSRPLPEPLPQFLERLG
jgi:23S rRNA pseudouridine1911/1915/1917 synthase